MRKRISNIKQKIISGNKKNNKFSSKRHHSLANSSHNRNISHELLFILTRSIKNNVDDNEWIYYQNGNYEEFYNTIETKNINTVQTNKFMNLLASTLKNVYDGRKIVWYHSSSNKAKIDYIIIKIFRK